MPTDEVLLIAEHDGCHFEIQQQAEGFYVWRFVGDSPLSTHDYLQDDLPMALRCAHQWGIPDEAWKPASAENPSRLNTVHNPPMQRTGAAGLFSFVRKLLGRGSGR